QNRVLSFQPGSGSITFEAGGAFTMNQGDNIDAGGRDLSITAASLTLGNINGGTFGGGGAINLTATNGGISAGQVNSNYGGSSILPTFGKGGSINLSATGGDIILSTIIAKGLKADGGDVTINVNDGNFSAQIINTIAESTQDSFSANGNGGEVTVNVTNGSFSVRSINTGTNGGIDRGGDVTINADGGITADRIDAASRSFGITDTGKGGTITLNGVVQNTSTVTNIGQNTNVSGTPNPDDSLVSPGTGGTSSSADLIGEVPALTTNQLLNNLLTEASDLINQTNAGIVNAAIQVTGANSNLDVNEASVILSTVFGIQGKEPVLAVIGNDPMGTIEAQYEAMEHSNRVFRQGNNIERKWRAGATESQARVDAFMGGVNLY
ncbi:MAG: hypothetical protein RLP02_31830, partial [Coleofasciculus sp. C2-GNP5-27]